MVSIVIPSRDSKYLQQTVDELLNKAEGDIEVIVVLDGYWPDPTLEDDKRVTILHQGTIHDNFGMRACINSGVDIANGEYIMKIDEHCMVDQGYDVKLIADFEDNWVVVPRRYRLDVEKWKVIEDGRPPIDYMYLSYPFNLPEGDRHGLSGKIWDSRYRERESELIDDTMIWQGSCWFMKKKYWYDIVGPLDDVNYGSFAKEAQEIANKVWLSGGRLVVNKKTWYAHYHKSSENFGFSSKQYDAFRAGLDKGRIYCADYWLNNKWEKRIHDFEWLIEKFWPVPHWPENWKQVYKNWQKEHA